MGQKKLIPLEFEVVDLSEINLVRGRGVTGCAPGSGMCSDGGQGGGSGGSGGSGGGQGGGLLDFLTCPAKKLNLMDVEPGVECVKVEPDVGLQMGCVMAVVGCSCYFDCSTGIKRVFAYTGAVI